MNDKERSVYYSHVDYGFLCKKLIMDVRIKCFLCKKLIMDVRIKCLCKKLIMDVRIK